MTEKLYEISPYTKSCDAVVLACEKKGERYLIELDQSCMFPEGGGQPSDIGTMNGAEVFHVSEKGGRTLHECEKAFAVGEKVHIEIDFDHRFRYMQLHTAEHIVSGVIYNEYKFMNVGFHMHDAVATIDIAGNIDREMAAHIEKLANKAVWDNLSTEILYPEDITKVEARKYPETNEPIRLVRIPGIDSCGCCGVHVMHSGEIGLIKLLSAEKHRGGTRMTLICGEKALSDYAGKHDTVMHNAARFSVKPEGLTAAIDKQATDMEALKRKLYETTEKLYAFRCENIAAETTKNYSIIFEDDLSADELRRFAAKLSEKIGIACVLTKDNGSLRYAFIADKTKTDFDLRPLTKDLNQTFSGKGGGKPEICQGFLNSGSKEEVQKYLEEKLNG